MYIVVDKNNQPQCVIEFANIQVLPYNEITWEMAKLEGEDENLEAWREKQREYLEDEAAVLGFDFTPDIRLVFQNFRVIYK